MLKILLDENISPVIAKQLTKQRPGTKVISIVHWHDGQYLGAPDRIILEEAFEEKLTLLTYDKQTMIPLIKLMAEHKISHSGVILVDHRTIPSNLFGALIKAMIQLLDKQGNQNWINRIVYLAGA